MRKVILYVCVMLLAFAICGCDSNSLTKEPTLKINKNGQVTGILVEEFDKEYYSLKELEDMIRLEISEYNQSKGEEKVSLEILEAVDGYVRAKLNYDSYADYAAFNETEFFAGTVEEAVNEGFNLNVVMVEADGSNTINPKQIKELANNHIVIWQGDMTVDVPGRILYHVEDVNLEGARKIKAEPDLEGPFYLLYK